MERGHIAAAAAESREKGGEEGGGWEASRPAAAAAAGAIYEAEKQAAAGAAVAGGMCDAEKRAAAAAVAPKPTHCIAFRGFLLPTLAAQCAACLRWPQFLQRHSWCWRPQVRSHFSAV